MGDMMTTDGKTAVIIAADLHINSTLAICPSTVNRDDGGTYQSNRAQRWLLKAWKKCWSRVDDLVRGYKRVIVLNGDITELDTKSRSWQLISRNPATVQRMTVKLLDPVIKEDDTLFVIRGTEAHTGKNGYSEEILADDLGAEPCPETETASWWHLRARFSGVLFDIAHHYNMGRLPHTAPNAANKLAFITMWQYYQYGETPPDVVVRSHVHRKADSGDNFPTKAFFTLPWQLKNSYAHRIGVANSRIEVGLLLFLCENGKFEHVYISESPERSKPWTPKQRQQKKSWTQKLLRK